LAGSLAAGLIGCSAPASNTDLRPEGPPEVLQVFATERAASGNATLGLYYSANKDYDKVDANKNGCGDEYEANDDDCVVDHAVADLSQEFRIVFDELLNGASVEQFVCACAGGGEMVANCPNMMTATLDPAQCQDNPNTADLNESGRWLDDNNDGMPDDAKLLPGLVTVTCENMPAYTTDLDDGFYNPSGNQLIPVAQGLGGLGPALVIQLPAGLRTDTGCSLAFAADSKIVDKEGIKVPSIPTTATFHTEPLAVLVAAPADKAKNVPLKATKTISVTFDALVDPATLANIKLQAGGVDVPATVALSKADPEIVTITPTAALAATTTYTIKVPDDVKDIYGGSSTGKPDLTFTTGAM